MCKDQKQAKKGGRTATACERCKQKKTKCNGSRPCLNCVESQSSCKYLNGGGKASGPFYKKSRSLNHDLHDLKFGIEKIAKRVSSNGSPVLRKSLAYISLILEKIQPHLYLPIESEEIKSYEGTFSIETEILGKHSRCLNRFSNEGKSRFGKPLSLYFGMYSPLLLFSSVGIGWLIKKVISYSDDSSTRESIYLLIKFFDESVAAYEANHRPQSNSPLKIYAQSKGLHYDDEKLIERIIVEISDGNQDMLRDWQSAKPVWPHELFVSSVRLMQQKYSTPNQVNLDAKSIEIFLKHDELLLSICIEYFERSLFSEMHDLDFLKGLLLFIENRYWIEEPNFIGRILGVLCRRMLDTGLNRWEYYAFQTEYTAEENRKLWWECYWWDRWYALTTGKPPLISPDTNRCLIPRVVMELGVDDSMDCLTLMNTVLLDLKKADACIAFFHILLAKLITKVVYGLLYNIHFTDYRICGILGSSDLSSLLKDLKIKFFEINEILQSLQENMIPFLEENFQRSDLFELYIHMKFVSVCCFQSMEILLARIQNLLPVQQRGELNECLKISRDQAFNLSVNILLNVLKQKDSYQLVKCSWCIFIIILNISSYCIADPSKISVHFLSVISGVIGYYSDIIGPPCNSDAKVVRFLKRIRLGTTSSLILTRICFQTYMISEGLSVELIIEKLQKYGYSCSEMAGNILNIDFIWYRNLICNHRESDFGKEILSNIDKSIGDFSSDKLGNKRDDCKIQKVDSQSNAIDHSSLESFLNSNVSLDLFDELWDNIPPDIFDQTNEPF